MGISVIIPVYNGAATVAEAIDSALAQGTEVAEIIVVNDGSTDSTPHVLEQYGSRIKVIHRANGGLCAARNTGLRAASGEYIALLDADDVWRPGRLSKTAAALDRNPTSVLAFSDYLRMNTSGEFLEPSCGGSAPTHDDLLTRGWPILPSAVTLRRSALEKVGGFCEEFKGCAAGEDHYMWLLLSEHGPFQYIAEPLLIYRVTPLEALVAKYDPGRRTFERLVRERYGARASGLIRGSKQYFANLLLAGASEQLDAGNFRRAVVLMCRTMRYSPFLATDPKVAVRLFNLRNARRITKALSRLNP